VVRRSLAVAVMLSAQFAYGQYVVSTHAGTIHFTTGDVSVDGAPVTTDSLRFIDLAVGQVLRTAKGRAEILVGPGVFLRLDIHSAIRMLDVRLEAVNAEVLEGTALVEVIEIANGDDVHVTVGPTRTGFRGIGLHRFNADSKELRVFGGRAEIADGERGVGAERGTIVKLNDTLAWTKFDPRREVASGVKPSQDGLHQWAARRSWLLYRSNPEASAHRTNWETRRVSPDPDRHGIPTDRDRYYVQNRDYDFMLYVVPRRPGQKAREEVLPN